MRCGYCMAVRDAETQEEHGYYMDMALRAYRIDEDDEIREIERQAAEESGERSYLTLL